MIPKARQKNFDYLFVYGTLKSSNKRSNNNLLGKECAYLCDGYFYGQLFEVAGYPGAIQSTKQDEKVFGQIYKLLSTDAVFSRLDNYEECSSKFPEPHEYQRKRIQVLSKSGSQFEAWCYLYNRETSDLRMIKNGHYR